MAQVGQTAALRRVFEDVYARTKPHRVLVLGCTTGRDFELLDPGVTSRAVGIDINSDYLAIARQNLARSGRSVELLHADVLEAVLPLAELDLIHAALLVEYVDPVALFRRIGAWLAPAGVCSIVSQNPIDGIAPVSRSPYESLRALDGHMSLMSSEHLRSIAARAGLECTAFWDVNLPGAKSFSVSLFGKKDQRDKHRQQEIGNPCEKQ